MMFILHSRELMKVVFFFKTFPKHLLLQKNPGLVPEKRKSSQPDKIQTSWNDCACSVAELIIIMQKSEAHVQDLLARTPCGYAASLQKADSGVCGAGTARMAEEDNGKGAGGLVGEMGENNEILSGKGLHWRFIRKHASRWWALVDWKMRFFLSGCF